MSSIETPTEPTRVRTVPLHAATLPSLNGNRPAVHHGVRRNRFSVDVAGTMDLVSAAVNANNWVLSYVNALANTKIPTLSGTAPSWWTAFTNQWVTVKTNANVWIEDNYIDGRGASYAIYAPRSQTHDFYINRNKLDRSPYGYTACVRLGVTVTQFDDNRDGGTGALIAPDNGSGGSCTN